MLERGDSRWAAFKVNLGHHEVDAAANPGITDDRASPRGLNGSSSSCSGFFRTARPGTLAGMLTHDSVLNLPNEPRMLDMVRGGLERAETAQIAVSFTRCSGLGLLIDPLRDLAIRGGRVRILTSTYQCVTQPEALEVLASLPGVSTRVQTGTEGFHSKFWMFRWVGAGECWSGSSNLTKGGLCDNIEWNLKRGDPSMLETANQQFEQLWKRPDVFPLDQNLIRRYRSVYREHARITHESPLVLHESTGTPEPNSAQIEALASLQALRDRGERRAAVIAATGVGKTYLAAFDMRQSSSRRGLYVSHRLEHLSQAKRTFAGVFGDERSLGIVGGAQNEEHADIVFATVASLARRPALAAREFDYVIVDEFHHAEAPSYEVLRPLRERAFLLGLTATPERQDGHDVLEWCDWNVAYEVRLPEAIDRGWLAPFHYFGIADETIDFARVPWRMLDDEGIGEILCIEERADLILRHALERGFDGQKRATIGFCSGRKHALFMADAFRRRGEDSVAVLGDSPVEARERTYGRLADVNDSLQWIFVADVLNEGVDIPAVNSVLFLRPTESATIFLQQLGRGLRLYPETEVLTVLDFVGHHRSAWLTVNALDAPAGAGRRVEVAEAVSIKPPRSCEVVLQRRTREILSKVKRFTTARTACVEAYARLREEVGRPLLPIDLWSRNDAPALSTFRQTYGSWLECQAANGDLPSWAASLAMNHPTRRFLRKIEQDWQQQRVGAYGLVWGMCISPDNPSEGYEEFFRRLPQWKSEYKPLAMSKAHATVLKELDGFLDATGRLATVITESLRHELLPEVEGRLLYTINKDHRDRHEGVIRTPQQLNWLARYTRPEIVRHFGVQYDPTKHNFGILWFDNEAVILTKLNTSSAVLKHQYVNRFLNEREFSWTSQNRMGIDNEAGRRLLGHETNGGRIHLFVQARSHEPACYAGGVRITQAEGHGPMRVTLEIVRPIPGDVISELQGRS